MGSPSGCQPRDSPTVSIPKISVVIPAYNEEKFIGRCLRSACSQTLSRDLYEIIVINDCSIDKTLQSIEPYRDDIVLVNNAENIGLPGSLNRGIREAKGQFIVRIDADDFVLPEYLHILSLHLRLNNALDAVACDYQLVDERQNVVVHMNCQEAPIGCAIMYRIEQLIDVGLYDEAFLAREDEDLRIRFLKKYTITRIPLPLYKYHLHGENLTADKAKMERFSQLINEKHRP